MEDWETRSKKKLCEWQGGDDLTLGCLTYSGKDGQAVSTLVSEHVCYKYFTYVCVLVSVICVCPPHAIYTYVPFIWVCSSVREFVHTLVHTQRSKVSTKYPRPSLSTLVFWAVFQQIWGSSIWLGGWREHSWDLLSLPSQFWESQAWDPAWLFMRVPEIWI